MIIIIKYGKDRGRYGKRKEGQPYSQWGYDQFGQPLCKHLVTAEWCDICKRRKQLAELQRERYIANRIRAIDHQSAEWERLKQKFPRLGNMDFKKIPKVVRQKHKRTYGRTVA